MVFTDNLNNRRRLHTESHQERGLTTIISGLLRGDADIEVGTHEGTTEAKVLRLLNKGNYMLDNGNLGEALSTYQEAAGQLTANPGLYHSDIGIESLLKLGTTFSKLGRFEEARQAYGQIVAGHNPLSERNAEANVLYAKACIDYALNPNQGSELGDVIDAANGIEAVQNREPGRFKRWINRNRKSNAAQDTNFPLPQEGELVEGQDIALTYRSEEDDLTLSTENRIREMKQVLLKEAAGHLQKAESLGVRKGALSTLYNHLGNAIVELRTTIDEAAEYNRYTGAAIVAFERSYDHLSDAMANGKAVPRQDLAFVTANLARLYDDRILHIKRTAVGGYIPTVQAEQSSGLSGESLYDLMGSKMGPLKLIDMIPSGGNQFAIDLFDPDKYQTTTTGEQELTDKVKEGLNRAQSGSGIQRISQGIQLLRSPAKHPENVSEELQAYSALYAINVQLTDRLGSR